jgi:NAD(P)-dependent dehydrogenase (short-subunit alcohol dehydrogenase family)
MNNKANQNKIILITGCSSGIGLYCAQQLKKLNYRVFATARKEADVQSLINEGFESTCLDLSQSASIQKALAWVLQKTDQKIDVLFNNGAYGQPGATEDLTREVMRDQFETNLFGTMELTNSVIPIMRKQGYGKIIHNSSILGFISFPFRGAYNASKYALEGFADTQRLELHGSGISISLIEPGPITSKFRENAFKNFVKNIDKENSYFKTRYKKMEQHFSKKGPAVPFTLTEGAVYKRLLHALNAKSPQARYYVTFPTYLFGYLKRILPTKMMDWLIQKAN